MTLDQIRAEFTTTHRDDAPDGHAWQTFDEAAACAEILRLREENAKLRTMPFFDVRDLGTLAFNDGMDDDAAQGTG